MKPHIKLAPGEVILTAYAESAADPGWANSPVWVIIRGPTGIRQECIQPREQSREIGELYAFSQLAHLRMTAATRRLLG